MDWEGIGFRTFMGSLIVGAAALVALGIFALCQDHTVKSYYVGDVRGCIYAEVNWDQDTPTMCPGQDRVVEFLKALNDTVKK